MRAARSAATLAAAVVVLTASAAGVAPSSPPAVVVENDKPGTPGWASAEVPPDGAIEGYTVPSAARGETIAFHVAANPPARYRVVVYRMGYYGGIGARLVACLPACNRSAAAQPRSATTRAPDEPIHAGWPAGPRLAIPSDWVSGYYLVRFLLTSGSHAGSGTVTWLILRRPAGAEKTPVLVQASPTTWQAYNNWGGASLYDYNGPSGRAPKVGFDRPYRWEVSGGLLWWDLPLVRFLERNGYDVSYQADVDGALHPSSLAGRRLIVVAGHSEYWAKELRDGFDRARAAGTNLAFFGANAAYWQVRFEDGGRTIVGYKDSTADPEQDPQRKTDLFRALAQRRWECELIGVQHQGGKLGWTTEGDYTVTSAATSDPWLRAGAFRPGDTVRGVVSREVDTIPPNQSPGQSCGNHITVLFHRELGGDMLGNADAVRFTAPSGATVFASGSHQFVWGLEAAPEIREIPSGLVDSRLQRFARAMLDELAR